VAAGLAEETGAGGTVAPPTERGGVLPDAIGVAAPEDFVDQAEGVAFVAVRAVWTGAVEGGGHPWSAGGVAGEPVRVGLEGGTMAAPEVHPGDDLDACVVEGVDDFLEQVTPAKIGVWAVEGDGALVEGEQAPAVDGIDVGLTPAESGQQAGKVKVRRVALAEDGMNGTERASPPIHGADGSVPGARGPVDNQSTTNRRPVEDQGRTAPLTSRGMV
jgi:hypothetical protein